MDEGLLALLRGLGLALAAGLVIGVVLPPVMPSWGVVVAAAPLGVLLVWLPLNAEDDPVWPAIPIGVIAAGLAATVSREVAAGATRRQLGEAAPLASGPPGGVTLIVVLAAIVVAVVSVFAPPVSILVAAALAWLAFARRRRAQRKHEGLRVLR
jgi:hypothetical protein